MREGSLCVPLGACHAFPVDVSTHLVRFQDIERAFIKAATDLRHRICVGGLFFLFSTPTSQVTRLLTFISLGLSVVLPTLR